MDTNTLLKYVTNELTGGGVIDLDVEPSLIESFINDALERVRIWYREPVEIESVSLHLTETRAGYVDLTTALTKPVHIIDDVWPIRLRHSGDFVLQEISDLLGLPSGLFTSDAVREYATWISVRDMIRKSMGLNMTWRQMGNILYVDDVRDGFQTVTVVYCPVPQTLSEITFGPAISWVKDWVLAKTKVAWAGVLGKLTAGVSGVQTNASELRVEGNAMLEKLDDKLKTLQFSFGTTSRGL